MNNHIFISILLDHFLKIVKMTVKLQYLKSFLCRILAIE